MTPSDTGDHNGPKPDLVDGTTPTGRSTQGAENMENVHEMGEAYGEDTHTPTNAMATERAGSHSLSKSTPAVGQEATQHLRAAQGNLEGFAGQIAQGEYGPNGAGEAGRIWRTLAAIQDPNHLVDAWGEIMAMSTGLWSVGKLTEAIELVDASARSFPVPDVWRSRVDESLKAAKDYQAAREAENAFQDGRDDDALQYADKISNQSEAEHYRRVLKLRLERRKKQRRAIFTIAGVAMIGLIVASGIAISTMGRISIAPPTPDFTGFGDALEEVSNDLRQQREVRDGTTGLDADAALTTDNGTPSLPLGPTETPDATDPTSNNPTDMNGMPDLDQMLGGGTDATDPPNPTVQQQTDGASPVLPQEPSDTIDGTVDILPIQPTTGDQESPISPDQPTAQEPTSGEPQTIPPTETGNSEQATADDADAGALRANCILGYGGLSEAQKLVEGAKAGLSAADLETVEVRIRDFTTTLEKACAKANLGTTELLRGVGDIEPQQLRAIAESILLGQQ